MSPVITVQDLSKTYSYRRRGKGWQKPIEVPYGGAYETPRVLPGFRLVVDPDR